MLWYTWSRSTVKSFLKTGESLSNKSASRHASEIILSLGSTHEHQNTGFFPDDLFSYVMGTPMSTDVGVDHHIHSEDERKSYMLLQLSSEERCNFFFFWSLTSLVVSLSSLLSQSSLSLSPAQVRPIFELLSKTCWIKFRMELRFHFFGRWLSNK